MIPASSLCASTASRIRAAWSLVSHFRGTATPPGLPNADYNLEGALSYDPMTRKGTVAIPEGAGTALLQLLPIADSIPEGTETAVLTIDAAA